MHLIGMVGNASGARRSTIFCIRIAGRQPPPKKFPDPVISKKGPFVCVRVTLLLLDTSLNISWVTLLDPRSNYVQSSAHLIVRLFVAARHFASWVRPIVLQHAGRPQSRHRDKHIADNRSPYSSFTAPSENLTRGGRTSRIEVEFCSMLA